MTLTRKSRLRSSSPPKRAAGLKRSGRIRPKPRSASEYARIYGSRARVEWVKSLGCAVCCWKPCENAHTVTGGTGRKADYTTIIPLCREHHRRYDQHRAPFSSEAARDGAKQWAAEIERRWQSTNRRDSNDAAE